MVAGVGPAQDRGGHPVTRGGELGSLALTSSIGVSTLIIIIFVNNNNNNNIIMYGAHRIGCS